MIAIDEADVSDIPAIKRVLCITWQNTYKSALSRTAIDKVTNQWHSIDILKREIELDTTYVGIAKFNTCTVGAAFYQKHGFDEVNRIEDEVFGEPLQSIVMEREI